jgi:hypothetical protein
MFSESKRPSVGPARRAILLAAACSLPLWVSACQKDRPDVQLDNPELAAFVRLMMPKQIEVQHYLTKPVSFAGDGNADGLEVILAALDSFGDPIKVVGTFHFELNRVRLASANRLGERVAFWKLEINSKETFTEYWDHYSGWYVFPLQFDSGPLEPGRYILTVRLLSPTGETLFDEYQFEHVAGVVPGVSPRY